MKKVICLTLALALLLCLCTGCVDAIWDAAGSYSSSHSCEGLTMDLPANMIDLKGDDFADYELVYANDEFGVFVLREPKSDFASYDADMDLTGYEELMQINAETASDGEVIRKESAAGNPVLIYDATAEDEVFSYYTVLLEGSEAFFTVQYYCSRESYSQLESRFAELEATIRLS